MVNDKQQVLVIEEKWATKRHWKLPGGLAEPGRRVNQLYLLLLNHTVN